MQITQNLIFSLALALLFTHEMDAIRKQEWKMFILLKEMEEERAYRIFMLLHIPLYTVLLMLLFSTKFRTGVYLTDTFLIAHMLIHLGFRNHPANRFNNGISKGIIFLAGVLAIVHILIISW